MTVSRTRAERSGLRRFFGIEFQLDASLCIRGRAQDLPLHVTVAGVAGSHPRVAVGAEVRFSVTTGSGNGILLRELYIFVVQRFRHFPLSHPA